MTGMCVTSDCVGVSDEVTGVYVTPNGVTGMCVMCDGVTGVWESGALPGVACDVGGDSRNSRTTSTPHTCSSSSVELHHVFCETLEWSDLELYNFLYLLIYWI